jgi:hypothetical protein
MLLRAHQSTLLCRCHLPSLTMTVLQVLPRRTTSRTWARFRVGSCGNPYPAHYTSAFAFSNLSSLHHHRPTLRPAVLRRGTVQGFRVPCQEVHRVRSLLSTGRRVGHEKELRNPSSRLHYHFGSSANSHFRLSYYHDLYRRFRYLDHTG